MRIRSRYTSAAWKAVLAISAWVGILINCGVFRGQPNFSILRYYTLISNVLIAGYYTVATGFSLCGRSNPLPTFKGALIMGITVTGLVFHLMLSNGTFRMAGSAAVANQLLHTVTPVMAVLDWLLFDEKGGYDKWSPLKWTVLPDLYFVFATIYGFTSGGTYYGGKRFPYFFIDYDEIGVSRVLLYVAALNVAFIALGYVFVWIDHLMRKRRA